MVLITIKIVTDNSKINTATCMGGRKMEIQELQIAYSKRSVCLNVSKPEVTIM